MSRILIVSNRLPVTVSFEGDALSVTPSAGGLATGLKGPHERSGGLWIGWPGVAGELPETQQSELHRQLEELRLVGVPLSDEEVSSYYEGYCNGVVWPLFHYLLGQLPLEVTGFEMYERVNQRFADAVVEHYRPGDLIWVQDYQLMRLPALLRERLPDANIGFFLHIPFPSSEAFRTLPNRELLLEGLLGADLLGFHTASYVRHFASSVLRVLGVNTEVDAIRWQGRQVNLGVFPMGIDADDFIAKAQRPHVQKMAQEHRALTDTQLIVGIDRLDYTKGLPRRLLAFERLLDRHPELREKVRFVQVAVPSRTNVEAYRDYREHVDQLVGRIHGRFATPNWVPVHYLFRGLTPEEVVALYLAADVMAVTPIRDGMNLVAKEFVASRVDEEGVLVLSELAGAASELAEALLVNPYDIEAQADALHEALFLPAEERRSRMQALRKRVRSYDVHRWVASFLERLERSGSRQRLPERAPTSAGVLHEVSEQMKGAGHLVLFLDYDGTLVPFAKTPELAKPDAELLELLTALRDKPRTEVHLVSGRGRDVLSRWMGHLGVGLHAEHGFWSRLSPEGDWTSQEVDDQSWRKRVLEILHEFEAHTPGSLVEEKTSSVAWHWRTADPEYGGFQANELRLHLQALLSNSPVEVLRGNKVIEVRPYGAHKGRVVAPVLAKAPSGALAFAIGDDRTDEDLFASIPEGGVTVHVGPAESRAQLRLAGVKEARGFLRSLLE